MVPEWVAYKKYSKIDWNSVRAKQIEKVKTIFIVCYLQ